MPKFAFNYKEKGRPIAIIKKKSNPKFRGKIVSVDEAEGNDYEHPHLHLDDADEYFQVLPYIKPSAGVNRNVLYVTGQSGSGKSFFTRSFAQEYNKKFPRNNVILFTGLSPDEEDVSLKGIKNLRRMNTRNREFIFNNDITSRDFQNSLVIFDDTDVISNENELKRINQILDNILETGRHQHVSCIYITHAACDGRRTKRILNESNSVTVYPLTMGGSDLKYLCVEKLGLNGKQVEKLKNVDSRAVTIIRGYPPMVVTEGDIGFISDL